MTVLSWKNSHFLYKTLIIGFSCCILLFSNKTLKWSFFSYFKIGAYITSKKNICLIHICCILILVVKYLIRSSITCHLSKSQNKNSVKSGTKSQNTYPAIILWCCCFIRSGDIVSTHVSTYKNGHCVRKWKKKKVVKKRNVHRLILWPKCQIWRKASQIQWPISTTNSTCKYNRQHKTCGLGQWCFNTPTSS